jgi:hypothetical protein
MPAAADGTASAQVTLDRLGSNVLQVRSHSANGWVTPWRSWSTVFDNSPVIASDTYPEGQTAGGVGVPGAFHLSDTVPGVTSYVYSVDWGATTPVPAGSDTTATITWTPATSGFHELEAYAVYPDGTTSPTTTYDFTVAAP